MTNNPNAVLVFGRTPEIARVSRNEPFAALPWEDIDAISHACAGDLMRQAAAIPDTDVLLYRTEGEFPDELPRRLGDRVRVFGLQRGDFGAVLQQAVDGAFLEGYHRVAVVIDNNPLMTSDFLRRALDQLHTDEDCVVVCPTDDDRVSMVALKSSYPSLFTGDRRRTWQKPAGLMSRLCEIDALMFLTSPVYMLDTPARLDRLRSDIERIDAADPSYPGDTAGVFRTLEKKYKIRKASK